MTQTADQKDGRETVAKVLTRDAKKETEGDKGVDKNKEGRRSENIVIVDTPNRNDVICGRGGGSNNHTGNVYWRILVKKSKPLYICSVKRQKMVVAQSVVNCIRSRNPPGNFLEKDGSTGKWKEIGQKRAIEKTSQALRESAPIIRQAMGLSKEINKRYAEEIDNWRFECNRYADEMQTYMEKLKTGSRLDQNTGSIEDSDIFKIVSGKLPTPPIFPAEMSEAANKFFLANGGMPASRKGSFPIPMPQTFGMHQCPMPPMISPMIPTMMPTFPMQTPFPHPIPTFYNTMQNPTSMIDPFCPWLPNMTNSKNQLNLSYNPSGPVGQFPSPPILLKELNNEKFESKEEDTHKVSNSQTIVSGEKMDPKSEKKSKASSDDKVKHAENGMRKSKNNEDSLTSDENIRSKDNLVVSKISKTDVADSDMTKFVRKVTNDSFPLHLRLESTSKRVENDFSSCNPFSSKDKSSSHEEAEKVLLGTTTLVSDATESEFSRSVEKKLTTVSEGIHPKKTVRSLTEASQGTPHTSLKRKITDQLGIKQRNSHANLSKIYDWKRKKDSPFVDVTSSDVAIRFLKRHKVEDRNFQMPYLSVQEPSQNCSYDTSEENTFWKKGANCDTMDNNLVNQTLMDLLRRQERSLFENAASNQLMKALQEDQTSRRQELFVNKHSNPSQHPLGCSINYAPAETEGFEIRPKELLEDNENVLNRYQNIIASSTFCSDDSFIQEERNRLLSMSKRLNGSNRINYPAIESMDWGNPSRVCEYIKQNFTNAPKCKTENEAFQMLADAAEQRMTNSVYPDDVKS